MLERPEGTGGGTMPRAVATTTIKRPVEDVWAVVSDPTTTPKWRDSLLSVEKTSDEPTGVGSTFRGTGTMFGRHNQTEFTVAEFEADRTFAIATMTPFPLTITIVLEPAEDGTRVEMIADAEPRGFLKLAQPLMVSLGRRNNQKDLGKLRDLLERDVI
jgi:uncharacterized protein YndB with AHSA1/START domain